VEWENEGKWVSGNKMQIMSRMKLRKKGENKNEGR
jgi:hypothetical protein